MFDFFTKAENKTKPWLEGAYMGGKLRKHKRQAGKTGIGGKEVSEFSGHASANPN